MTRDPAGDVDDPDVQQGPLRRTVTYRIGADQRPERAQVTR